MATSCLGIPSSNSLHAIARVASSVVSLPLRAPHPSQAAFLREAEPLFNPATATSCLPVGRVMLFTRRPRHAVYPPAASSCLPAGRVFALPLRYQRKHNGIHLSKSRLDLHALAPRGLQVHRPAAEPSERIAALSRCPRSFLVRHVRLSPQPSLIVSSRSEACVT